MGKSIIKIVLAAIVYVLFTKGLGANVPLSLAAGGGTAILLFWGIKGCAMAISLGIIGIFWFIPWLQDFLQTRDLTNIRPAFLIVVVVIFVTIYLVATKYIGPLLRRGAVSGVKKAPDLAASIAEWWNSLS